MLWNLTTSLGTDQQALALLLVWGLPLPSLVPSFATIPSIMESIPMSAFLIALSTWLHTLATVVFIGHYLFLSLVYLPVLEQQAKGIALRELLEEVSSRLRPYFGSSLLIFIVTGTHLMLINEDYLGLGNFFGNAWSVLIVIKHVLVLGFLALAIFSERAIMGKISDTQPQALNQFRLALGANLFLGILILLLTTAAQTG